MPNLIPRDGYFTAPVSLVVIVPKRRNMEPEFGVSEGSHVFPVTCSGCKWASRGMF